MKFTALLLASALGSTAAAVTSDEVAEIFCQDTIWEVLDLVEDCPANFVTIHTDDTGAVIGTTEPQASVDSCIADCNAALQVETCADFDEAEKIDFVFTCLVEEDTTTAPPAETTTADPDATTTDGGSGGSDDTTTDGGGGSGTDDTTTDGGSGGGTDTTTDSDATGAAPVTTGAAIARRKLDIIQLARHERIARQLQSEACENGNRVDNAQDIACKSLPADFTTPCPADICAGTAPGSSVAIVLGVAGVLVAGLVQ